MVMDNDAANRKVLELTTDVYPHQGLDADDNRMVINGVLPEYVRPRQREFWDRYMGR